jgi:hypothetical protein
MKNTTISNMIHQLIDNKAMREAVRNGKIMGKLPKMIKRLNQV